MFDRKCQVCDSNNINGIFYDLENLTMRVFFVNGEAYDYTKVPVLLFGTIVGSESVGSAFQKLVRNNSAIKYSKVGF